MAQSTVAVIVPVFNRPAVVIEALESVVAQTLLPQHLVVVDDGSTDATAEHVERWLRERRLSKATLVRQANAGPGAARNHGVAVAGNCDLLAFLDSDDLWPPDYLERMCAAMSGAPDAVAASCDRVEVDGQGTQLAYRSFALWQGHITNRLFKHGCPGNFTVIQAAAFHRVRGFDESLRNAEDWNLHLRLSLLGRWLHVPEVTGIRRNFMEHIHLSEPQITRQINTRPQRLLVDAAMLDRFIHEDGGAAAIPSHRWRKRLGNLWYETGCELSKINQISEARRCYQRTVQVCPWHLPGLWRRLTIGCFATA